MIFKPGTDQMTARQLVQERIAQVAPQLPTWAAPPRDAARRSRRPAGS